jgi:hypothetical protein
MRYIETTPQAFAKRIQAELRDLPVTVTFLRYGKPWCVVLMQRANDPFPKPVDAVGREVEPQKQVVPPATPVAEADEPETPPYPVPPKSFGQWPLQDRVQWAKRWWPDLTDDPNADELVKARLQECRENST